MRLAAAPQGTGNDGVRLRPAADADDFATIAGAACSSKSAAANLTAEQVLALAAHTSGLVQAADPASEDLARAGRGD